MSRGFSIEKLFSKGSRRQSETSLDPISPSIFMNDVEEPVSIKNLKNRARSLSLMSSSSHNSINITKSKSPIPNKPRSKSVNKKQAKELIKQETNHVIAKKLHSLLKELGLQPPVPLAIHQSNSSNFSKSIKIYVANSNNCIYLGPSTSGSFTYEDVENGGVQDQQPEDNLEENDDDDDVEDIDDIDDVEDVDHHDTPITDKMNGFESVYGADFDNMPELLKSKIQRFKSPNYLCTKIDSTTPIPHTFGLIVELEKDTPINNLFIEFSSLNNILWPSCDPYNKTFTKEKFKIGKIDWLKNLKNADFYINNLNSHDFKFKNINPDDLAKRTRFYKLFRPLDLSEEYDDEELDELDDYGDELGLEPSNSTSNLNGNEVYKAGIYIFLLPVLLPPHIPPTITSISGSINHLFTVSIHKNSEKLNRKLNLKATYNLPMVRTPPSFANSIADKPIYVNRVWNDSLHYIITFPRKYVSLGSEHTINVKIVPLVKDVVIKRIKFNVLERITYVSKNLSREYDYDGEDPYHLKVGSESKQRERVIPICELKTKNKASSTLVEPYKEEVIKCRDNNLLYCCYEPNSTKDDDEDDVMIASPLDINIALPFLTTKNDKLIQTTTEEKLKNLPRSSPTSRKASIMSIDSNHLPLPPSSPIIGALETNLSHNHSDMILNDSFEFLTPDSTSLIHEISHNQAKENIQHGYTTVGRALYPDSNYRHIQISHRLQVCFRISKPDPKDNYKMHHYEVVVDTPLILLSSKCNEESVQLPRYDDISEATTDISSSGISFRTPDYNPKKGQVTGNGFTIKPWDQTEESLPSFEEATSPISSPIVRSVSIGEDPLSRIPSITSELSPHPPAYDADTIPPDLYTDESSFNIDAVVTSNDKNSELPRHSKLRSSLVSSFAPNSLLQSTSMYATSSGSQGPLSITNSDSSGTKEPNATEGDTNSTSSVSINSGANSGAVVDTSSTGMTTDEDASKDGISLEDSKMVILCNGNDDTIDVEEEIQQSKENSTVPLNPEDNTEQLSEDKFNTNKLKEKLNKLTTLPNDSESNISIITHGSFDQRLPLLRNVSTESNIPLTKEYTVSTPYKLSTDNLAIIAENKPAPGFYKY